jgi:hypothetical protein
MDQQLADRQKDLEAAEQKRQEFEAKNAALMPGTGSVSAKLEGARSELRGVESDLLAAQSALASINGQLSGTPPTITIPGTQGGARGALAQAQADLASMKARGLTDSHPDVLAAKAQIASLQRQAAAEGAHAGTPNPAYASLQSIKADREASLVSLQSRKASLQQEIGQLTGQQYSEPAVAAEAARINRDYDVLKDQYDKLLRDREQLRLRGQVESEHNSVKFDVIDPPSTPRGPSAPDRPLLLMLVLVVGWRRVRHSLCHGAAAIELCHHWPVGAGDRHDRAGLGLADADRHGAGAAVEAVEVVRWCHGRPGAGIDGAAGRGIHEAADGGMRAQDMSEQGDTPQTPQDRPDRAPVRKTAPSLIERAAGTFDFRQHLRTPAVPPLPPKPVAAAGRCPCIRSRAGTSAGSGHAGVVCARGAQVFIPATDADAAATPLDGIPSRQRFRKAPQPIDRRLLREQCLIEPEGPVSALLEEFRIVKRHLLLTAADSRAGRTARHGERILVCSAHPARARPFAR